MQEKPSAAEQEAPEEPAIPTESAPDSAFNLRDKAKEDSQKGVGFNQFDPVLTVTTFISRRFGLAGGLIAVGLLAATEGNEILKSVLDKGPQPGSGQVITRPSGLSYKDVLVASNGGTPQQGTIIGLKIKVSIEDKVLYDTASDKPVAFRYGKRPFENVLCEGVEQGIEGMKVGGVREIKVPSSLAPKGIQLPDGVPITYLVEVTEILPGYF
jgi:hypothetical protein